MSEAREIMAAAIDNEHRRAGGPDSWLPEVDVALAALTAAGFEVRRTVDREAIEAAMQSAWGMRFNNPRGRNAGMGDPPQSADFAWMADAVLKVLNAGQEP